MKSLSVGDRVQYIVTNVFKGKKTTACIDAVVLELPRSHLAKIQLNLHGKIFTPTVRRSHLAASGTIPKPLKTFIRG